VLLVNYLKFIFGKEKSILVDMELLNILFIVVFSSKSIFDNSNSLFCIIKILVFLIPNLFNLGSLLLLNELILLPLKLKSKRLGKL
jgi:hypothetical protein